MTPVGSGRLEEFIKRLPYRKWWFWLIILILIRVLYMAYDASRPIEYDAQALGFASEEKMNEAFAKGYHSRQKMEEMARFYAEGRSGNSSVSAQITRTFSPSFDCSKATTRVTNLICSDAELSSLDRQLAAEFKAALADQADPSGLAANQREWLQNSLNTCVDKACVLDAYKNRIAELAAGD